MPSIRSTLIVCTENQSNQSATARSTIISVVDRSVKAVTPSFFACIALHDPVGVEFNKSDTAIALAKVIGMYYEH
jgi:hypothetical protein